MKTILTTYTAICLICPIFNIEDEQEPTKEQTQEVAFWCDCGVEMRWSEVIMRGV